MFSELKTLAAATDLAKSLQTKDAKKLVIDFGGLAGAGKTTLLSKLNPILAQAGISIKNLDKDLIGQQMEAETGKKPSSAEIYAEMVRLTTQALADSNVDIVIREGNIIANLKCFKESILAEHEQGIIHALLYVQCSNGIALWNRINSRAQVDPEAKKRDADKLNMFEYLKDDATGKGPRAKETERHETALIEHASLFENGVVHRLDLDTQAASGLDKDRDAKINQLIQQALDFLCKSVELANVADNVFVAELKSYGPGLFA